MGGRSIGLTAFVMMATVLLWACTSADKKAAAAAALAENALNDGQLTVAKQYAQRALAARDDISDYWLLLAHIDIANNDAGGAFDAYQNVLTLDRGNIEALTTLCQIGLVGSGASRVEKFADQLAVVNPASSLPATVKAAIALERGDKDTADRLLQQVLGKRPDDLGALLVKSRVLAARDRYAEGAALIETAMAQAGNPTSRLEQLKELYLKAKDRAGVKRTVARLARANPKDASRQLAYADMLYDDGEKDEGYAVTRAVLTGRPGDIAVAGSVLDLWLKQGAAAMPVGHIAADSSALELEGKATYAQYADEIGRPELALAILGDAAAGGDADSTNSDAKVAAAYAIGLRGDRDAAIIILNAVLAVDPTQPRALLARARLRPDAAGALTDARRAVANDGNNVAARIVVAELLARRGETVLAEDALRDGLVTGTGDPRLAEMLARLLVADHRSADVRLMLTEFARANPISLRAQALAGSGRQ